MARHLVNLAAPWRDLAACRGYPTDWWYPERGSRAGNAELVCGACPVRGPCWEYGLHERFGIYGGENATARRTARREARALVACIVCDDPIPDGRLRYCSDECGLSVVAEAYQVAAAWREANPDNTQLPLFGFAALAGPLGPVLTDDRRRRGLTADDVAAAVGVSAARYLGWEQGRLGPERGDVLPLALHLHTTESVVERMAGLPSGCVRRPRRVVHLAGQLALPWTLGQVAS